MVGLSIIVPIYNGQKYLDRMIESLICQEYKDYEVLLIDDGSRDSSPIICDNYAYRCKNIKVIHQKNSGVSAARNRGLEEAKGSYVGFVDCDDSIKPYMFSKMISTIKNSKADMVMGGYDKVNDRNIMLSRFLPPFQGEFIENDIKKIIYGMVSWSAVYKKEKIPPIYGSTWPNLYKKELIDKYKIRFPLDIKLGEDLVFNIKYLLSANKVAFVREALYEYHIEGSSATRGIRLELWQQYKVLLEEVNRILVPLFGEESDYKYNINRQYINYAISTIEEQIIPNCLWDKSRKIKEIENLCRDEKIKEAATYIKHNFKNKKDFFTSAILLLELKKIIYKWLDSTNRE